MAMKQPLPVSAIEVGIQKRATAKPYSNSVVPIQGTALELYVKTDGTVVIRKKGRSGKNITSGRAAALHDAKGLRGPAFLQALRTALGKAPATMERTGGMRKITAIITESHYTPEMQALAAELQRQYPQVRRGVAPAPTTPAPAEVLSPVERAYMMGGKP